MDGLNINGGHGGLPEKPLNLSAKLKTPTFIVNHEPWSTGFFRRIKEFLTESPVKVPAPTPGSLPLVPEEFRSSFAENFREFFQPTPRALQGPVDSRFLTEPKSGISIFLQNVRDLLIQAAPTISWHDFGNQWMGAARRILNSASTTLITLRKMLG